MDKLDKLIEDLLFAHIAANAPNETDFPAASADDEETAELAGVQSRLSTLRTGYAQGTVSDETMFSTVPQLEARERKLKSELAKKSKARMSRMTRWRPVDEVRREWDAGDVAVRRAILSRYLRAIVVRKSSVRGPGFDYSAIEPIWKDAAYPLTDEFPV